MQNIFVSIYQYFIKRPFVYVSSIVVLLAIIALFISNLSLEEDINAIIPQDGRIDKIKLVLENSKFSDQIILNFSNVDSSITDPGLLKVKAEELVSKLELDTQFIKKITFKIQENSFQDVYDFFYNHLPFYLTASDYLRLDSLLKNDEAIAKSLNKSFKSLISPAGIATKKFIFRDPFSLTPIALKKLQNFQLDNNFDIHKSCIYTKDKKNLLVFIEPVFLSGNIEQNKVLIENIENSIAEVKSVDSKVRVEYYGGTAVAVANAKRIKADIMLTVNIAFLFIFALFFLFFRRFKVLILLFIPVVLGAGIAISLISIISGSISVIALGIGAILVGISIDYSLHIFTHFRSSGSIIQTLKDVALPILMSSGTTASAFLCLFIVKSEALNQLGMFGAFSVFFAALAVLMVIPVLLSRKGFSLPKTTSLSIFDKVSSYNFHKNKIVVITIFLLSIAFSFTFRNVSFNGDVASLNYLPKDLVKAEKNLENISSETLSAVYLVAVGETFDKALQLSENNTSLLEDAKAKGLFSSSSSAGDLILTKKRQKEKIEEWNKFWDSVGRERLEAVIKDRGTQFKEKAFNQFYELIHKDHQSIPLTEFSLLKENFLGNYLNNSDSLYSVISILKVDKSNKKELFASFKDLNDIIIFDKQYFSNQFFEVLKDDFGKLVGLSMIIVFGILLLSFGRIELAVITMSPILLSWLWTLGLMGLFGIKFNIFNIIISTFIFGLGIDYSIFIMRGLLNNHKYGNHTLSPYKLSILLSVITTILGIGVLIFAKHPALKSIALVSIFGISSVVIISYTILPLLFNLIVSHKGGKRIEPVTFMNTFFSVFSLSLFIIESIMLTVLIPILYIIPIPRRHLKYFFHSLISWSSRFIVWLNFPIKKTLVDFENIDFSKPSVIVSNHQSHLDLVLILRLHPKIVVVTNKWVWNNPIYGFVVRYADYYPIYNGIESDFDKITKKVKDGYSILIFPEGSRTKDGEISRYHQGAFKIADELKLDIQPLLIHGAFQCLPKTEFFMRSGKIVQKFYKKIEVKPVNLELNETYRLQAKALTKFMRSEFDKLREEYEGVDFYKRRLVNQFIYKSPVLEWYVKVKLRLEKNYKFLNDQIPLNAKIVDVGCGYGYLSIMLKYVSKERNIIGIDYDEEKISIAKHIVSNEKNIQFVTKDIIEEELPKADVYILNDVLHYMPEDLQVKVLSKCLDNIENQGMLIVRDADADLVDRTKVTKVTEIQSTKIFKFNKTKYDLSFISGSVISETAKARGFSCERIDNAKRTSNITYIIKPN